MFCPSCGAAVQSGQKFCTSCGSALTGAVTAGPAAAQVEGNPTPPLGQPLPPPAATTVLAAMPVTTPPAAAVTGQYPATSALSVVEQATAASYQGPAWDATGGNWEPTGMAPVVIGVHPFRFTPLLAAASLAAVLAVASAFVNVAGFNQPGLPETERLFKLNDFSSNLMVGAMLAALLLVIGASLGATGRRAGTGLAGGAGLALAGMMELMWGLNLIAVKMGVDLISPLTAARITDISIVKSRFTIATIAVSCFFFAT